MEKRIKRLLVIMLTGVFCMSIFAGCSKKEEAYEPEEYEPEVYEDEGYSEEELVEEVTEDEAVEDEAVEDEAVKDEAVEETQTTSSEGAEFAIGKWYTKDYDVDENWSGSYVIELKEDGTATCEGYRNKDAGTYTATGSDSVLITFDNCEVDEVGEGFKPVDGFTYTIDMKINGDDATITIDAPDVISNLEDGTLHRGTDEASGKADVKRSSGSNDKKGRKISFTTSDFEGKKITSEEIFSKHEVTMVNVWATWCYWCIDEMPQLDSLNKKLAKKDCAVVGLLGDVEDPGTLDEAEEILEENDVTYLNILPWDGAIEKDFRIGDVWPTSFFVDREGYIIGEPVVGAEPDMYEKYIDKILSGK